MILHRHGSAHLGPTQHCYGSAWTYKVSALTCRLTSPAETCAYLSSTAPLNSRDNLEAGLPLVCYTSLQFKGYKIRKRKQWYKSTPKKLAHIESQEKSHLVFSYPMLLQTAKAFRQAAGSRNYPACQSQEILHSDTIAKKQLCVAVQRLGSTYSLV